MDRTEAFRVLASADRQLVLHELVEADGDVAVQSLARRIAARRHGVPLDRIGDERVERARIRLLHMHLPLLAETEVVDFESEDERVSLADGEAGARLFDAAAELDGWPPEDLAVQRSGSD